MSWVGGADCGEAASGWGSGGDCAVVFNITVQGRFFLRYILYGRGYAIFIAVDAEGR